MRDDGTALCGSLLACARGFDLTGAVHFPSSAKARGKQAIKRSSLRPMAGKIVLCFYLLLIPFHTDTAGISSALILRTVRESESPPSRPRFIAFGQLDLQYDKEGRCDLDQATAFTAQWRRLH